MSNTVSTGPGLPSGSSKPPVPLEKPPHITELERKKTLLAKVKTLRDNATFMQGAIIEGNPGKEYCWVNTREDRRVSYEAMGWVLCKDPLVKTRWQQADGTHKRADLILYEIDKEMAEAIQAYNTIKGMNPVEDSENLFEAALDQVSNTTGYRAPVYKPKI